MKVIDLKLYKSIAAACQIAYIVEGVRLDPMEDYRWTVAMLEKKRAEVPSKKASRGRKQKRQT